MSLVAVMNRILLLRTTLHWLSSGCTNQEGKLTVLDVLSTQIMPHEHYIAVNPNAPRLRVLISQIMLAKLSLSWGVCLQMSAVSGDCMMASHPRQDSGNPQP
jgi:hypothetical protein